MISYTKSKISDFKYHSKDSNSNFLSSFIFKTVYKQDSKLDKQNRI